MSDKNLTDGNDVRFVVQQMYGAVARTVLDNQGASCCGSSHKSGVSISSDAITGNLYDVADAVQVPEAALLASLGCGNPTALAELAPGEVVLDLGSGGGV
jgi:arsenite methyltransferase